MAPKQTKYLCEAINKLTNAEKHPQNSAKFTRMQTPIHMHQFKNIDAIKSYLPGSYYIETMQDLYWKMQQLPNDDEEFAMHTYLHNSLQYKLMLGCQLCKLQVLWVVSTYKINIYKY